ncbi:MAG: AAA family ATPase [Bacteroidia bacterium]|jgi:AAA15 family ATPase/GTPase|nr:AAA family ATPase [Bacteroidia bacterium]
MPISSVNVKNYKTIKDASVSFKPGLNIIIGENGSGKTNFVEILNEVLSITQNGGYDKFNAQISFFNGLNLLAENIIDSNNNHNVQEQPYTEYSLTGLLSSNIKLTILRDFRAAYYGKEEVFPFHEIIPHGIPSGSLFLDAPVNNSIQIPLEQSDTHILQLLSIAPHETYFAFFLKYGIASNHKNLFDIDNLASVWTKTIEQYISAIKRKINYAPFSDIRISKNFSVEFSLKDFTLTVSNLYFEFFQNNRWNSFNQLSDGTKRLVIIFFSLFDNDELWPIDGKRTETNKSKTRDTTIIIEEPELGIHPNQLYQLMLLLQEEARNKQIIITTHSPVALDILEKDDLDSIIICSFNNEKGTTFNHLSEKQREKAIGYLEDVGYLSLYWTHSDLNSIQQ